MKPMHNISKVARRLAVITMASGVFLISATLISAAADKADELHAKAQKLLSKAKELKAAGAGDEAHKLALEADKLEQAANRTKNDKGERQERANIPEKEHNLDQIRAKLQDLAAAGKTEEAAKLKQQIAAFEKPKDSRPPKQGEVIERLQAMKREIAELHKQGRHEEAERAEQKGRAMMEALKASEQHRQLFAKKEQIEKFADQIKRRPAPGKTPTDKSRGRVPGAEEVEQRLHHLKAAIENLHAAGLHENFPAQWDPKLGIHVT